MSTSSISSVSTTTIDAASPPPLHPPPRQSILVLGAGAVGSLYGGRLLEAGHDVTFLMRREYDAVSKKGLKITSPDGDMYFDDPQIVRSMDEYAEMRAARGGGRKRRGEGGEGGEIGEGDGDFPVDWVIIALKTTSFPAIPSLLSNRRVVGKETRVLALMNGYGLEKDLEEKAGVEGGRIFGGMAFVCANRGPVGSGEVAHLKYGKLVIGHYEVRLTAP